MPAPEILRSAFNSFASGVTVVTCAREDGVPHGATISAFTAVSTEPALCQVTLTRTAKVCTHLDGRPFAVNVLAADQLRTALHFAGRPRDPEPEWTDGPVAPVLTGTAATISCTPWRTYDGGDHLIVLGEVVDAVVTAAEPLVYHGGRFRELSALVSDVHWQGSMDSPSSGWFDASTTFTRLRPHLERAAS
ncbi:NADH-FMN oxidoreductase RutF, flavin reductase (DIM6/NTAB) family [Quadrisphaera granulorum]|uniref:Flavin reductase (DIM6/NTAB) family NADH-FMN oxidoreductase RutF n=1 Tax=Quadrisphaera granulorum TaxID=317664 RepID=A0A316A9Q4_9ACTN|nr:flavin reductase family protein [Quadrisphaera granulorum]PWJ54139.1 flavin reductase (DIM6/NTAB) family NADH-FMN oxidoreductase RutF [Quadrisphaera granulorum]SZE96278.1 NADH-FMN oxidoreductase RutF, flavin reductase (DIM6/NTAB) family [Quadrisphaera granulorum]